MRSLVLFFPLGFALCFPPACSSPGDHPDASVDGGDLDADSGAGDGDGLGDGAEWNDGQRPDHDPSNSFLITVPPGTSLCTTFWVARSWQQELAAVGRIDLRPGRYVLPRQEGFYSMDFIESVHFGPDRTAPQPGPGEGEFEATVGSPESRTSWKYVYRKEYVLDEQPYVVEVHLGFTSRDDSWPDEVTLGFEYENGGLTAWGRIGPGEDLDEVQIFDSCNPPGPGDHITARTGSGNTLGLELRDCFYCGCSGFTYCFFLYRAEVLFDGRVWTVTDPFNLVYSAGHHNFDERFLLILDPPAGEVTYLLVVPPGWGGELVCLDDALSELRREEITEWESTR